MLNAYPNIVLITIDALRADHLSCLGYSRETTPWLDRFSSQCTVFSTAISQSPNTQQSFPSILASVYSSTLGAEAIKGEGRRLPDDLPTLAEVLRGAGYLTAAFHSNPYLSRAFNYHKGFNVFDDSLSFGSNNLSVLVKRVISFLKARPHLTAEEINRKAFSWLAKVGKESAPFFLWLHYMDTHGPYQPPHAYLSQFKYGGERLTHRSKALLWRRAKWFPSSIIQEERKLLVDLYDAEIRHIDDQLQAFMRELRNLGLVEDTLIVITGDHGEQFGEHGMFDHLSYLYDELLHVPLFLYFPSRFPKGRIISEPVGLIDLVPTIVDLIGIAEDYPFQGESLLPLMSGGQRNENRAVISEVTGEGKEAGLQKFSVRTADHKYIVVFKGQDKKCEELYDLTSDPEEKRDLAETQTSIKEELYAYLQAHLDRFYAKPPLYEATEVELNKEVEERLRGLGYID